MTERYSADEAETMMKLMGPKEGKAFFARHPELAPGTEKEYPTVQEDPLDGTDTTDATDATDDIGGAGLSVEGLAKDTANYQKRLQDLRMKQFETARNVLKERQAGPSVSQQLFQLSSAFFRPKYTRGFAGTMANVMPVLAKQQEARDTGEDAKADTLRELQDKYDTGTLTGEGDILDYKYKLQKLISDQAKAAKPKLVYDPNTHNWVEKPEDYATPHSLEELEALPDGTLFKVWTGPNAGRVIPKVTKAAGG